MLSLSPVSVAMENTHHILGMSNTFQNGKHLPVVDLAEMAPEQTRVLLLDQTAILKDVRKFIMLDMSLLLL